MYKTMRFFGARITEVMQGAAASAITWGAKKAVSNLPGFQELRTPPPIESESLVSPDPTSLEYKQP